MTVVNVAAAILMRRQAGGNQTEFLLAQRPQDKVYAGYWEFPGGKVEAGETTFTALVRELDEELGIFVEQAYPWLSLQYTYPHATVRLKFFHIHAWHGEIRPIEHTGLIWTTIGQLPAVSPVLPANGPILRALELPDICVVTHLKENGMETELSRLRQAFENGLKLVLIGDGNGDGKLGRTDRQRFAEQIMRMARNHDGTLVMVEDNEALARHIQADGLYLSSANLASTTQRPPFAWAAASCHDAQELAQAANLGLDFAVLDTRTPGDTDNWAVFSNLVETSPIPVFALSRSEHKNLEIARINGAHGIALIPGDKHYLQE